MNPRRGARTNLPPIAVRWQADAAPSERSDERNGVLLQQVLPDFWAVRDQRSVMSHLVQSGIDRWPIGVIDYRGPATQAGGRYMLNIGGEQKPSVRRNAVKDDARIVWLDICGPPCTQGVQFRAKVVDRPRSTGSQKSGFGTSRWPKRCHLSSSGIRKWE